MRQLNKSLASMIRGKSIEEAIRFSFFNHKDKFSIKAAQDYANDLYYLRTKNLTPSVVKFNAKPINALVRSGVNLFLKIGIKNLKNVDSYSVHNKENSFFIYPDFVTNKLTINKKNITDCCVELKVSNCRRKRIVKKHSYQCFRYSTKSGKPVILVYLFFSKKHKKDGIYQVSPKLFIIFNKRMRKFHI